MTVLALVRAAVRWRELRYSPAPSGAGAGARSRNGRLSRLSFAPGAAVSEVARRASISPGQIYRWRQELRAAGLGFAPVLIAPAESAAPPMAKKDRCSEPAIEVEFAGKIRVRIPGSVPAELAAAVLKVLALR